LACSFVFAVALFLSGHLAKVKIRPHQPPCYPLCLRYNQNVNWERRKALENVFFDVAKYLLTTTAVGSFVVERVNLVASTVAVAASFGLVALAYYITPPDKET
jgi:hypothetical protein